MSKVSPEAVDVSDMGDVLVHVSSPSKSRPSGERRGDEFRGRQGRRTPMRGMPASAK